MILNIVIAFVAISILGLLACTVSRSDPAAEEHDKLILKYYLDMYR